ncbi:TIGR02300 family protein [Alisedimentitalea sp. MJ-SS2]|uniref:TIGR02300 family protein n=1 Tax=Aliisedimentitalea sp. MJ-SS2 TaxID=3049795 RepID=UPI00290CAEFD|nr:TIGR02300 family protein [Alisedimentitalea sp. MJ-SS2]MDU8927842.1 TIGR02300 family protein [Alisedimentitalea sp. MJ-SS2]
MPKEEWGVKRICPTTGKRFYDLNKDPAISPYTGEAIEVETGKRSMIAADAEDAASKKAKEGEDDLELDSLDADDADVELEDDVLDDDDDDTVPLEEIADVATNDDE